MQGVYRSEIKQKLREVREPFTVINGVLVAYTSPATLLISHEINKD